MQLMSRYEDNHFDLAIVDPPYGIGDNFNHRFEEVYDNVRPTKKYFRELFRVSKNQIIWGGNYFTNNLPESKCWIVWDKMQSAPKFSDFEMAWTSFSLVCKLFQKCNNGGFINKGADKKIHPTQKHIKLYEWLLINYAKEGDKILDTHLGSGSIAIAIDKVNKIDKMNLTLTACELDKDYFDKSMERIKTQTAQQTLF